MASSIAPGTATTSNPEASGELNANVFQIARLNNMLPRGYRFELYEVARKNDPSELKSGKRKKTTTKRSEVVTGQEYEKVFQENDLVGAEGSARRTGQKFGGKRYSSREKKPVTIDDLGYVDKEQGKKGGFAASEGYKKCERLLGQLKKHPCAGQFMTAPTHLPGYNETVKEPMDLNTVERKLRGGIYPSSYHFALDIRKIWNNSWTYNQSGSEIYNYTTEISNYFEKLMKEVGDVQFVPEEKAEIQALKKRVDKVTGAIRKMTGGAPSAKAAGTPKGGLDKPMTTQEKAQLRQKIMMLPQEKLQGVIAIIQDMIDTTQNREVLEFDIDALPTRKCRELEQYVSRTLGATQKPAKKKAEPKPRPQPKPKVPAAFPMPPALPRQNVPQGLPEMTRAVTVSEVQPSPAAYAPMTGLVTASHEEKKAGPQENRKLDDSEDSDESDSKSGITVDG